MIKINKKILRFFSVLSDETRLNIVLILAEGMNNVGEIHKLLGEKKITLSAVSHQLKQMENLDIVSYKKHGREKRFKLANGFCWCVVKDAINHLNSGKNCKCKECLRVKTKLKGDKDEK